MPEQEQPSLDKVRALVGSYAQACLADLGQAITLPRPEASVVSADGWTVLVLALPSRPGEGLLGLTDCERDCLALLSDADEPLSGERAWRKMKRGPLGPYGLATIKRSLVRLKRLGVLGNFNRGRQRGYYLPERLPLFRRLRSGAA